MITAEFSLEDSQIQWLEQSFGFKDKSLRESAQLYAEIYETDEETRALTEAAIVGWPQ